MKKLVLIFAAQAFHAANREFIAGIKTDVLSANPEALVNLRSYVALPEPESCDEAILVGGNPAYEEMFEKAHVTVSVIDLPDGEPEDEPDGEDGDGDPKEPAPAKEPEKPKAEKPKAETPATDDFEAQVAKMKRAEMDEYLKAAGQNPPSASLPDKNVREMVLKTMRAEAAK